MSLSHSRVGVGTVASRRRFSISDPVRSIAIYGSVHEDVERICREIEEGRRGSLTCLSIAKLQVYSVPAVAKMLGTNTSLLMLDLSRQRMGCLG